MKTITKIIVAFSLLLLPAILNAQVLISLLFGDALNTDKIEFGLDGGMSHSYITTIDNSKPLNTFDLGFYFHVLIKNNSYLSTGVHVKSTVGAKGMPTYELGDTDFDDVFKDGELTKKIPTFYVPILFHQRFNNRWYIEAGPQLGLIHKPTDIFEIAANDGDVSFKKAVKNEYKHIDMGLVGGIGYKLKKEIKSTAVGINYYYGLLDISKTDQKIKNSAIYFYCKIPIGAGKSAE